LGGRNVPSCGVSDRVAATNCQYATKAAKGIATVLDQVVGPGGEQCLFTIRLPCVAYPAVVSAD
jgi:hypothetical protein